MVDWFQACVLALIQGLTEFLPISSSAHLILLSHFSNWQYQGELMDIAAHVGTLLAVIIYFRQRLWAILFGDERTLLYYLLVSAIPLGLAGLLMAGWIDSNLRQPAVIAAASAVFGVLLWWSQRFAREQSLSWRSVVIMSLAQVLALIPGASRSGITMTAGMWAGLSKSQAASFSFLMAIPAIGMTAVYGGLKWWQQPDAVAWLPLMTVVSVSFVVAFITIHWFMKWIERIDFVWFMHYRWLLALLILVSL